MTSDATVIFIVGTGHSGSTLVDLILGSHSRSFSLGQFSRVPEILGREQPLCSICPGSCPVWGRPEVLEDVASYFSWARSRNRLLRSLHWRLGWPRPSIHSRIASWTGARVLIDSSKSLGWVRRQLRSSRLTPNLRTVLLFVHRDGRAVVNSNLRKYPERGVESISRDWAGQVERIERFFERAPVDERLRVGYERLSLDPYAEVPRLCEGLGLPYESAMLRYWQGDHHLVSGNAGTYSLIFKHRDQAAALGERDVFDEEHYHRLGLSIRLDLRWRRELSAQSLETFERTAGRVNLPYAFEPAEHLLERSRQPAEAS